MIQFALSAIYGSKTRITDKVEMRNLSVCLNLRQRIDSSRGKELVQVTIFYYSLLLLLLPSFGPPVLCVAVPHRSKTLCQNYLETPSRLTI